MLAISDYPIKEFASTLDPFDLKYGFVVPTETGLKKSIMDAPAALQDVLLDTGFHDFKRHSQGPDHKVVRSGEYWGGSSALQIELSLYRPKTKNGDPRIWPYKLGKFLQAGNLLALIPDGERFLILNGSKSQIRDALKNQESDLSKRLLTVQQCEGSGNQIRVIDELVNLICEVNERGPVLPEGTGSGRFGLALERELGIPKNVSKEPDFKGIEIKTKFGTSGKQTLFSMVPSQWTGCDSALDLVNTYGYVKNKRRQLYTSISTSGDSLGFSLKVSLGRISVVRDGKEILNYSVDKLENTLLAKHQNTAFVAVEKVETGEGIGCRFSKITYHANPCIKAFLKLVTKSEVCLDFTVSRKGDRVRDHGYLWRVKPGSLADLYANKEQFTF